MSRDFLPHQQTNTTNTRTPKPRLTVEEKALREEMRDLREKAYATNDYGLHIEANALRAKLAELREAERAALLVRQAQRALEVREKPRRPRLSDEERALRDGPKRPRGRPRMSDEERALCDGPRRPRGRPRLSDDERALRNSPAYNASYWGRNKETLTAKRKARLAGMTEEQREVERQLGRVYRNNYATRQKARIAELLQTVEALNQIIESEILHIGEAA
jgi:hypothetical protein